GPEVLDRGADLVDDPDELVPERRAHPGVGHHAVVQVQVGAADGSELHPDDRVVRVLDGGDVLLLDADLVRTAVDHRAHGAPPLLTGRQGDTAHRPAQVERPSSAGGRPPYHGDGRADRRRRAGRGTAV